MNKNQALLYLAFVMPIQEIIEKITTNKYRDCDIKNLDKYYKNLVRDCAKILRVEVPTTVADVCEVDFPYFNEHVKKYYLEKFTILLGFFNNIEITE